MKTPDFKDRLNAASAAKKAQLERARAIAEDPERQKRIKARSEIIAARNSRIAERERDRREAIEREVAERAAAEAAEAAAREAARKIEEDRAARLAEQARLDAAAAAEREARHRQVVGCWIVKDAMDRSTVVGRRDHAAMAMPVISAQVANAWRRAG